MTDIALPVQQENVGSQISTSTTPTLRSQLNDSVQLVRKLSGRLAAITERESIAVIGMAARFPGSENIDDFWDNLVRGNQLARDYPPSFGLSNDLFDSDPTVAGKSYVKRASFLNDNLAFDVSAFGVSPREAQAMDPQQRLALEVSWHALEHAGLRLSDLRRSNTGVFVGASTSDYVRLQQVSKGAQGVDMYQLAGELSFLAGRLSYFYDFVGRSEVIDTACSSSLVAVHSAVQALRTGEADLALAGGVNLILSPFGFVLLSKSRALAPDGRCKPFDDSADGYGRGEGSGFVVLKCLSKAVADGDTIHAVIRGSAVNHDGRSSGITVPNPHSQVAVMRAALADAGIGPSEVGFIEAHGTGTPLGDPIELESINTVYGGNRGQKGPVCVASVKGNIGHLEAAAGIAGLIKSILCLERNYLPESAAFERPNSRFDWARSGLEVRTTGRAWDDAGRNIGLSSFGASGTNCHVVLGCPTAAIERLGTEKPFDSIEEKPRSRPAIVTMSAESPAALQNLARSYGDRLENCDFASQQHLADASTTGRDALRYRLGRLVDSNTIEELRSIEPSGTKSVPRRPLLSFVFSGQGSQSIGMGMQLCDSEPVFRSAFQRCRETIATKAGWDLFEIVRSELVHETRYTQPALVAFQWALAEWWLSMGAKPTSVVGHSIGEISAAAVAGVFSIEDALGLAIARGKAMSGLGGSMLAVRALPSTIIDLAISGVELASVNSPDDLVLAGERAALQSLEAILPPQSRPRFLEVSCAFHSKFMDQALPLIEAAAAIEFGPPMIPIYSTLTGGPADEHGGTAFGSPAYWVAQARNTVRFADAITQCVNAGATAFLEISPVRTLAVAIRKVTENSATAVSSFTPNLSDIGGLAKAVAALFEAGHGGPCDQWAPAPTPRVALPLYPFDRLPYWFSDGVTHVEGARAEDDHSRTNLAAMEGGLAAQWLDTLGGDFVSKIGTDSVPRYADVASLLALGLRQIQNPTTSTISSVRIERPIPVGSGDSRAAVSMWVRGGRRRQWLSWKWGPVVHLANDEGWIELPDLEIVPTFTDHRRTEDLSPEVRLEASVGGQIEWTDPASLVAQSMRLASRALSGRIDATVIGFRSLSFQMLSASSGTLTFSQSRERGHDVEVHDLDGRLVVSIEGLETDSLAFEPVYPLATSTLYAKITEPGKLDPRPVGNIVLVDCSTEPGGPSAMAQSIRTALTRSDEVRGVVSLVQLSLDQITSYAHDSDNNDPNNDDSSLRALATRLRSMPRNQERNHVRFLVPGSDDPETATSRCAALLTVVAGFMTDQPSTHEAVVFGFAIAECVPANVDQRSRGDIAARILEASGRSFSMERPMMWSGVVTYDNETTPESIASCFTAGNEEAFLFRNGEVLVERLAPVETPSLDTFEVRPNETQVITGGFGGLGLRLAMWLIDRGATSVALVGRRGVDGLDERDAIARHIKLCPEVHFHQLDVSDSNSVKTFFSSLSSEGRTLGAIYHLAGTAGHEDLSAITVERVRQVISPKAIGAVNVLEMALSVGLRPKRLVLFSSIASTWGSKGAVSYAGANGALSAIAERSRAQGIPASVVEWGPWAVSSGLADESVAVFLRGSGLRLLEPVTAFRALGSILASEQNTVVVADVDWFRFRPLFESRPARTLLQKIIVTSPKLQGEPTSEIHQTLLASSDQQTDVVRYLQHSLAVSLGQQDEEITEDCDLLELGLDSLMVIELIERFNNELGIQIDPVSFFTDSAHIWPSKLLSLWTQRFIENGIAGSASAESTSKGNS